MSLALLAVSLAFRSERRAHADTRLARDEAGAWFRESVDTVDTLFQTVTYSLGAILVIKFGVGGVWAARDRFWPAGYDGIQ